MRRFAVVVGVVMSTLVIGVGSAAALSGGGRSPSQAPLVAWGTHYEASLGNNEVEANYNPGGCCDGPYQVGIWRLGPLSVHDQVVVNWHSLPFAHGSGFPVRMVFVENIEDYSWGSVFEERGGGFQLAGSGTAKSEITVKNTSANDYLEFYSFADESNSQDWETYPYDFSVEAPRHYLSLALGSVQKVATNGYLHGTAMLATGVPVPDGTGFTLTGTWSGGGVFTTSAASVAGQITFPLALPETAIGKSVSFVASSAASTEYQAATSSKMTVEVTKPPAPAPSASCSQATAKVRSLTRLYRKRLRRADSARGRQRGFLFRKAHAAGRKLNAARAAKRAAC